MSITYEVSSDHKALYNGRESGQLDFVSSYGYVPRSWVSGVFRWIAHIIDSARAI